MYKKGDIITVIRLRSENEEYEPYLSLNKRYVIQGVDKNFVGVFNNHGNPYYILLDNIKSVKPTNEIEYLDAFQQNFKEGV